MLARFAKKSPEREPEPEPLPERGTVRGYAVGDSNDLRRILALPRRQRPSDEALLEVAARLKAELGVVGATCECQSKYHRPCCAELLPVQAWALDEARKVGGLLGPVGVGHGKTLLDLLTSMVVRPRRVALLLIPPNLKKQLLEHDWGYYSQHWQLPNLAGGKWLTPGRPTIHVVAFSELSGSRATDLLSRVAPDVVIVDEAHSVRNRSAARTKRFLRYLKERPDTKLFSWSGTLTSRSLKDYAHLSNAALHENSPTPIGYTTVEEWAAHLDPSEFPGPAGRLRAFADSSGDVRLGYQKRVVETLGVVSSGDAASCQASLTISERKVEVPPEVAVALDELEESWERPDHEEALVDAMSVARCARELSCGFFYRWRWPRKEPRPVIDRWLAARKAWHKELREKLKESKPHMDSPLLLARAAIRWFDGYIHIERDENNEEIGRQEIPPYTKNGPLPVWRSACWKEWKEVRDSAKPETEPVWLSNFLVEDAAAWLREGPGLCWYEFDAFGRAVDRLGGGDFVFCGPGADGDSRVLSLDGNEAVVASIRAHGTGKNLQSFGRNLVATPPSDGATWEQLMGRTHRTGQAADEVTFEVYRHTEPLIRALDKARDLSEYIESTFGARQRLSSVATWTF